MYEIENKFLNEDGSIDFDATEAACRRGRARAAGAGFRVVVDLVRDAAGAGRRMAGRFFERIARAQASLDRHA